MTATTVKKAISNPRYNKTIRSRIFVVLNRNIDTRYHYHRDEVQKALLELDFNFLNQREKSIYGVIFKEFDSNDFKLLEEDFIFNLENIKKIFTTSFYAKDSYLREKWQELFNLEQLPIIKTNTKYKKSSRLDAILNKKNSNL